MSISLKPLYAPDVLARKQSMMIEAERKMKIRQIIGGPETKAAMSEKSLDVLELKKEPEIKQMRPADKYPVMFKKNLKPIEKKDSLMLFIFYLHPMIFRKTNPIKKGHIMKENSKVDYPRDFKLAGFDEVRVTRPSRGITSILLSNIF